MIRVNLLPHREEKRKIKREQFYALAGLLTVLAGVIWFLGYTVINGYISSQQATNEYLEKEISVLAKQIDEISSLKEQTEALLARKQVIESLQGNRAQTVTMFSELLHRIPDGIRLVSLVQDGRKVDVTGEAFSEARVSTLIRSLNESPLFEHAVPIEIRAMPSTANNTLFTFQLTTMIVQPSADSAKTKPRSGGAAKG